MLWKFSLCLFLECTYLLAFSWGSFVVASQIVQSSMAQDLSQLGQQVREKMLGRLGGVRDNQTDNQTGNQSSGMLDQLGEKARNSLPGR
jgi:hypothetical protein